MPLKVPFRKLPRTPEEVPRLSDTVTRNFAEVEKWAEGAEAATAAAQAAAENTFPNKRVYRKIASASTTSNTYVAWPVGDALSGTFTKRSAATRIIVTIHASARVNATNVTVDYGVSVDGAPAINVINGGMSESGVIESRSGSVEITGLDAGAHTFGVMLAGNGSATVSMNANDMVVLVVEEVA